MPPVLDIRLPAVLAACRQARTAIQGLGELAAWPTVVDDVRLLVSELIANSVHHGGLRPSDVVRLVVDVDAARVLVEIHDRGGGFATVERPPDEARESGRGLLLLRALSDRHSIVIGDETVVSFEIAF